MPKFLEAVLERVQIRAFQLRVLVKERPRMSNVEEGES